MSKINRVFIITILLSLILLNLSNAQNYYTYNTISVDESKYSYRLGIWNTKLTGDTFAPTTNFTVDLQNDLGFGNYKGFITFDFDYKLSNINTIGFSFFSGTHKAVRTVTRNITIPADPNDFNITANTTVFSSIKYSAFDLSYKRHFTDTGNYSFYWLGGVRFNNLDLDFTTDAGAAAYFEVNAPTLFLGFGGSFKLSESLAGYYKLQGLTISSGGSKLNYMEYSIGLDYMFNDKWGLNIGYRYMSNKAEDDFSRSVKLKYQGLNFGISGKF